MITQAYLDYEIALVRKTFMYYTDRLYNYLTIGSDKYQQWYRDSLQLYFLMMLEESVILIDRVSYIGYYEMTDDVLRSTFDRIREYYRTEVETVGEYGDSNITIIVPTTRDLYLVDWKEVTIDIVEDNTLSFTLPFLISNIDPETLIVNVDDSDPIPCNVELDGYHITNNIFYWHHYFDLNIGNRVYFKYKQIAGL